MIQGVITTQMILRNPILIVKLFGFLCLFRCVAVVVSGERTTFLELAWRF